MAGTMTLGAGKSKAPKGMPQNPADALAAFLGVDSGSGFVNMDAPPMHDPALELASLRGTRQGELEDRVANDPADVRSGALLKMLSGDIHSDPFTGDAARVQSDKNRAEYTRDVNLNEPTNPLAIERQHQEQFDLKKTALAHPNQNSLFPGAGTNTGLALRKPELQAKFDQVTADLPDDQKATVRGILQYDTPIPTSGSAYTKILPLIERAQLVDPHFDYKKYQQRQQYMTDYAKGGVYKARTGLDTVMQHLDSFANAAGDLHNSGGHVYSKGMNYLGNLFKANTSGYPELEGFENAANAVSGELSNIFKASGATDHEIASWRAHLDAAATPDEFKARMGELIHLINGRMDAVQKGYRDTMGEEAPDFLSPQSRAIYEKYKGGAMAPAGAEAIDPEVAQLLQSAGPGTHTLSDGSVWDTTSGQPKRVR